MYDDANSPYSHFFFICMNFFGFYYCYSIYIYIFIYLFRLLESVAGKLSTPPFLSTQSVHTRLTIRSFYTLDSHQIHDSI